MTSRVLVACLGNIFLGDDGFGVAVARRLAEAELPDGVQVTDYGTRGMRLAYDLARGWDTTVLVDATRRGGAPGTVYLIEPEPDGSIGDVALDPHGMQPDVALEMAEVLGGEAGRVLVVACEPANVEEGIGLSAPVADAVDEAARLVCRLAGISPALAGLGDGQRSGTAKG